MKSFRDYLKLTGIPVLIASLCCVAPVVLVAAGISTVSFAAGLSGLLDGQFRWAFILAGIVAFTYSLVMYFRKRGICTLDQAKKHRNEIINKVILAGVVGIVLYHLFFNLFLTWAGRILKIWN